ncbi:MAG TPA: hypothetical protein VJ461_01335 [Candidatus Nanoarchaeia archaeon]|nr:hypothetical protein [Candidatus Nanoarchaeia archaeon]
MELSIVGTNGGIIAVTIVIGIIIVLCLAVWWAILILDYFKGLGKWLARLFENLRKKLVRRAGVT